MLHIRLSKTLFQQWTQGAQNYVRITTVLKQLVLCQSFPVDMRFPSHNLQEGTLSDTGTDLDTTPAVNMWTNTTTTGLRTRSEMLIFVFIVAPLQRATLAHSNLACLRAYYATCEVRC